MSVGHIRQRRPGSWEIKYDVGRDPLTGKRVVKTKTVRGRKGDAQRELRRLLGTLDTGTHIDPGKLTLGAWLLQWLEEARHNTAPKTHERYAEIVQKHLVPALGVVPLAKLQPIHLQSYYAEALKSGRRDGKGGLSAQTVRHHDRVLNVALKRARALRLIATNPIEGVSRPKVERREIQVLEPEEAATLLGTARTTRLYGPILVALATGMRRGEVFALRWSNVDMKDQTLRVVQSLETTSAGLRFKAPKTNRSRRTIALPAAVAEFLMKHRADQACERLQLGLGKDDRGLVFAQLCGEPINPDHVTKEFSRLVKRAGIRLVTFHGLRHTHATEMLRANVHPKIVSERLGHASVAITLDTYSHVVPGLQEDAATRIDASLRKLLAG